MRISGGQALGEEAVSVVRQAVSLAEQRGHRQVTPLHMVSAMLSASPAPACILRAACLSSQSHPLQHKTLDLCLDLALNQLAVAVSRRGGDHVEPARSNAFTAGLKRAQAHGRRGPVGGDKVELEQLVLSILDDPSVDRVMRAAGFSSSQVRASVVSLEQSASFPDPFPEKIGAGGQPSLQTAPELHLPVVVDDVPHGSECQASNVKSGARWPAFFGCTEVIPTTVSLPPWLRYYKDTTCIRSTYCNTNLQANGASRRPKFTELTADNLKILCDALELRVPWHGNIVPGIASTVLRCRSGVTRRRVGDKPFNSLSSSTTTWLLFHGRDGVVKTAVARELARLVFGSYTDFTALQGYPDIAAQTGKLALKRHRSPENNGDGNGGDVGARLFKAIAENPHRVILIDGVDQLGRDLETRIKNAVAGGTLMGGCNGDVVDLEDAIIVLSSNVLDSRSMVSASSPRVKRRFTRQNCEDGDAAEMEMRSRRHLSWDLNVCAVDEDEEEGSFDGIMNVVDGVFLFN
ncbi:protein SMAX1-LIKE 3-like [Triticum dicoccoides]|uniref:protein SMAX1-LIKE 3-like n=1 Tax=Triticum dicoccoides TaxID=85692 RepID=UPI00188F374D|nr:protein SMAX1-LIKE 3-like [Triticum dicoccoides]